MGQNRKRQREKEILERIVEDHPDFLGGISFLPNVSDPPDFLAECQDGRKIGLELTSWVNESQVEAAQRRESKRTELQEILDWKRHPTPKNFSSVVINPHSGRVLRKDRHRFCAEFHAQAKEIDDCWVVLKNDDWRPVHQRRGFDHCEYTFKGYPVLRKYLAEVTFLEHIEHNPAPPENSWIGFESDGGFYDPETSIEALRTVINKKIADYGRPHKKEHLNKHNLSELYLLVYADPETFWHNTPYQTINQALISPFEGLQSVAMNAAQGFIEAPTVFAGVFLFYPLWRESRLLSICPRT